MDDCTSDPIAVALESNDEALAFGSRIAREMLERMPDLTRKGWCIFVYDSQGGCISVMPIGALSS
jgi:hypothetical protein